MIKSLLGTLAGMAIMVGVLLIIVRKGIWGPLVILGIAALYFVVTLLSELVKLYEKKFQGRDRHS